MPAATEDATLALSGVQPNDEHDLRMWTALAMWAGGICAVFAGVLLPGPGAHHAAELKGAIACGVLLIGVQYLLFRQASNERLYVLNNLFSSLGAVTIWLIVLWTGGASSAFTEMYFFPVLYDAYFFRRREVVWHLVFNSALVLSPLLYDDSLAGTQFISHVALLLPGLWAMSALVVARKQRLLDAELRSRQHALSDPLTGVHNRRSLREHVERSPLGRGSAVVLIDIDDFKGVNEQYGHFGADTLLRQVGTGLLSVVDSGGCVARIGGDEFILVEASKTAAEVAGLAEACARVVGDARRLAGLRGPDLSASIGTASYPADGQTLAELLAAADRTMYARKLAAKRDESAAPPAGGVDVAADPPRRATAPGPPAPAPGTVRRPPSWSSERPARALVAGAAWIAGGLSGLLALSLPGADGAHASAVIGLGVLAVTIGALVIVGARHMCDWCYALSDVGAMTIIALGIHLTGGAGSPLFPLVFVVVAVATLFSTLGTLVRLGGLVLVCAAPFLYTSGDARLQFAVRFVAIVTTAAVLVAIILYNKRQLTRAEETARTLASHDALTGLPNRRAFREHLSGLLAAGAPASVAIIDLDNFKEVNDRHGHAAGDCVLQGIARALAEVTRQQDLLSRIGGDEFALVAPGADAALGGDLGARCVEAVERAVADAGYGDCQVSATVGYSLFPEHGSTLDELADSADAALMRAKRSGKRQVACAVASG
jgi:diguanylate cyclase (GGDEF)-like protein